MKRPYETMVVFDGTLPEDVLQKEQKQFEELLSQNAEFEKVDLWGKRALAYPIRKKRSGVYALYHFTGTGEAIMAIDKYVKLNDQILRHLSLVRNVKNEAARLAVAARKEQAAPEADHYQSDHRPRRQYQD